MRRRQRCHATLPRGNPRPGRGVARRLLLAACPALRACVASTGRHVTTAPCMAGTPTAAPGCIVHCMRRMPGAPAWLGPIAAHTAVHCMLALNNLPGTVLPLLRARTCCACSSLGQSCSSSGGRTAGLQHYSGPGHLRQACALAQKPHGTCHGVLKTKSSGVAVKCTCTTVIPAASIKEGRCPSTAHERVRHEPDAPALCSTASCPAS